MNVKSMDPSAEEFCRIIARMIVEAARNSAQLVTSKLSKKAEKNGTRRK
jgi:hypothetical protein